MKLYYFKSACSLIVRIILNELDLPFEAEEVDLTKKTTASGKDFLSINPKGAVPTLSLDQGEILTETQVILQYLADITPGQKLLAPVGDFARYPVLECLNYLSTELHKPLGLCFNPTFSEEAKSKMLLPLALLRFAHLDKRLANGKFLMGEHFTLPDAYLFVMLRWAHYFKMDLSSFRHLASFEANMKARPAVLRSLQQEE